MYKQTGLKGVVTTQQEEVKPWTEERAKLIEDGLTSIIIDLAGIDNINRCSRRDLKNYKIMFQYDESGDPGYWYLMKFYPDRKKLEVIAINTMNHLQPEIISHIRRKFLNASCTDDRKLGKDRYTWTGIEETDIVFNIEPS